MFRGVHHIVFHIDLSNLEAWKTVLRLSFGAAREWVEKLHMVYSGKFEELLVVEMMKPRNSSIWDVQ